MQADPQGKNVVPWGESRRSSIWASMDRLLAAQKPEALLAVRQAGTDKAQTMLAKARAAGDEAALLAVYRMSPWSTPGQAALADYAELSLRKGYPGIALRSFRDVLSHTNDAELGARAQVGAWLASAQGGTNEGQGSGRSAFEAGFRGIALTRSIPGWAGRPQRRRSRNAWRRAWRSCLL